MKPTGPKVRTANPDPFEIFLFATAYWKAAAALGRGLPLPFPYNMPVFVVEAFSLELHLKCLLRVRGKSPQAHTHEPTQLFDRLDEADRLLIGQHAEKSPAEVQSVLDRSRGTFTDLRYVYEGHKWSEDIAGKWGNFGVNDLVFAIREVILNQHPDWAAKKDAALGLA